jgi:hypothetical protein
MAHRSALPEELLILGIVQRGQGPFVLVPVLHKGEERYAIAAVRYVNEVKQLQVLALCLNLEQDKDNVTSLGGAIATPLRVVPE